MNLVWHYAPWATLPQIVAAGALLPGEPGRDGEAPLLWFSARQDWEPTATRHVMDGGRPRPMTFLEHRQRLGCVRFGLPADDTRLLPWMDACRAAHMRFTDRRKLEASSRRVGANRPMRLAGGHGPLVGLCLHHRRVGVHQRERVALARQVVLQAAQQQRAAVALGAGADLVGRERRHLHSAHARRG